MDVFEVELYYLTQADLEFKAILLFRILNAEITAIKYKPGSSKHDFIFTVLVRGSNYILWIRKQAQRNEVTRRVL